MASGGQSVNTVAANANCGIDIRYRNSSGREHILYKVCSICETTTVSGTSSTLQIKGEFYPLNPSKQSAELFTIYKKIATEDDIYIEGEHSGGCADSGFIAVAGTPVICGVEPTGANYHRPRPDEWIQIDSLAGRARLIARTILVLADKPTKTRL